MTVHLWAVNLLCEPNYRQLIERVGHRIFQEPRQYSKVIVQPNAAESPHLHQHAVSLLALQNLSRSGRNYRRGRRFGHRHFKIAVPHAQSLSTTTTSTARRHRTGTFESPDRSTSDGYRRATRSVTRPPRGRHRGRTADAVRGERPVGVHRLRADRRDAHRPLHDDAKLADFLRAGVDVTVLIADLHAHLDDNNRRSIADARRPTTRRPSRA